jgi:deoxycytidylate deaminase
MAEEGPVRIPKDPATLAFDISGRSRMKVQMGAVLVDRSGRIFAWGWNSAGTHAEIHCLSRANQKRIKGSTLVVVGIRAKSGNFVCSYPCWNCYCNARNRGVIRIIYRDQERCWQQEEVR